MQKMRAFEAQMRKQVRCLTQPDRGLSTALLIVRASTCSVLIPLPKPPYTSLEAMAGTIILCDMG